MRLTSRRHGSKIELQMTSMIDCVFLLLIFFMVTSSFNRAVRDRNGKTNGNTFFAANPPRRTGLR